MNILLTSSSFIETPGKHHRMLNELNYNVQMMKGPLTESQLLPIIDNFDALICGDDELNEKVLQKGVSGRLKYISKYGVGLDKIDQNAIKKYNLKLNNCPGVNQISVAEHVFALILSFYRNIPLITSESKAHRWTRITGTEIFGKKIGIYGLGAIGKEVAKRSKCFGLEVYAFDTFIDSNYAFKNQITICQSLVELFENCDIISIHVPLNSETKNSINRSILFNLNSKKLIVNTSRGQIISKLDLIEALENNLLTGYLTDVLEFEPINNDEELVKYPNVFITSHVGSRTFESVERQGSMAVDNLIKMINSDEH
jgi:D-3-phosphoglycerate dehydrogenase